MIALRNVFVSRALGIGAVLAAPLMVVYGWWMLALAGLLAAAAALVAPRARPYGTLGSCRAWLSAIRRHAARHAWRPRPRWR